MTNTRTISQYLGIKSPNYKTQALDTSLEAEEFQFNLWRSCSFFKKVEMLARWTKGTWELSVAGIKHQYPNASHAKVRREFIRRSLGTNISLPSNEYEQKPLILTDPITLALEVANILNALDIPYLVGGSVASGILGEVRSTQDIDLVADLQNQELSFKTHK